MSPTMRHLAVPVAVVALVLAGCGGGTMTVTHRVERRLRGLGAEVTGYKIPRRSGGPLRVEPGQHMMAATGCSGGAAGVGIEGLYMDTPEPRCLRVTPGERIMVINRTGSYRRSDAHPVTVQLGPFRARLAPQEAMLMPVPARRYWGLGLHAATVEGAPGATFMVVRRSCLTRAGGGRVSTDEYNRRCY